MILYFECLPPDGSSRAVRLGFDVKDHLLECSVLRFEMFNYYYIFLLLNIYVFYWKNSKRG